MHGTRSDQAVFSDLLRVCYVFVCQNVFGYTVVHGIHIELITLHRKLVMDARTLGF